MTFIVIFFKKKIENFNIYFSAQEYLYSVWFFYSVKFHRSKKTFSTKVFNTPLKILTSNIKNIFHLRLFFVKFWGFEIWACSGLNYARFEEFFLNAEIVTRMIYAWRIMPLNKIVPN